MIEEKDDNKFFAEGLIKIFGIFIAYNEKNQENRDDLSYCIEAFGNHMNDDPSFYYDGYLFIRNYFQKTHEQFLIN
jgi:hypothetical protein